MNRDGMSAGFLWIETSEGMTMLALDALALNLDAPGLKDAAAVRTSRDCLIRGRRPGRKADRLNRILATRQKRRWSAMCGIPSEAVWNVTLMPLTLLPTTHRSDTGEGRSRQRKRETGYSPISLSDFSYHKADGNLSRSAANGSCFVG